MILQDLVQNSPGAEGKWFAAAKDAGLLDLAIDLAMRSPTDPLTLGRAARDYAVKEPKFAMAAGLASLQWMARGYGYELTGMDVSQAYQAVMDAGRAMGLPNGQIEQQVRRVVTTESAARTFVERILKL